ncbi:MAG: rhomboid family intramembrane serine protease [Bacteroidetes bacterium]|nr:rhomboid family intramembrane serine protease [Bacteroidota bacterium]
MARYQLSVSLGQTSPSRYLSAAKQTIDNLKWKTTHVGPDGISADSPMSFARNTWGENIFVSINKDDVLLKSISKGGQLIDWGRNRKNVQLLRDGIDEILGKLTPEELASEDETMAAAIAAGAEEQTGFSGKPVEHKSLWHIFIPKEGFFATPIIIELNILVFIAMVIAGVSFIAPDTIDILKWGGNFKPYVMAGQWWRLFSSMFVHFGILHLAFNMYALFYIGVYLEPLLGRTKFIVSYLAVGLFSSLVSTWWHGSGAVSAGASGAIFGLYGIFLALLTTNIVENEARKSLLQSIIVFIAYNLFFGFTSKLVDNSAHIGGLLSGFIIGYILYLSFREPSRKKDNLISAVIGGLALFSMVVYLGAAKDDTFSFEQRFNNFVELQNMALEPMQNDSLTDDLRKQRLQMVSLPIWKSALKSMDSTSSYRLPELYKKKRQMTIDYLNIRIQQTEAYIRFLGADSVSTAEIETQLGRFRSQSDSIVNEMNKLESSPNE